MGCLTSAQKRILSNGGMRNQELCHSDLFSYAMEFLVIQASEVSSERAFSWAGAFYADGRASMDPQVLADYLFIYANEPSLKKWRSEPRMPNSVRVMDNDR
jgi:hypothetical protein